GRVQALTTCGGCAREVLVVRRLRDPGRTTGLEEAAREPFTRSECEPLRERLELRRALACMPRADAAQAAVDGAGLPDPPAPPAVVAPVLPSGGTVHPPPPFLCAEVRRPAGPAPHRPTPNNKTQQGPPCPPPRRRRNGRRAPAAASGRRRRRQRAAARG